MNTINVKGLVEKARNQAKKKEMHAFSKNIGLAENFASNDDERREVHFAEIIGLLKNNMFKPTLKIIRETRDLFTNSEYQNKILVKRGIILGKMGRFDAAISVFEELTSAESVEYKLKGHANLVWIYLVRYEEDNSYKLLKAAEENCETTLDLLDRYEEENNILRKKILTNLGCVYYHQEEYDKALEVFKEQEADFAKKEDYPIVYNNIASALIEKGRIDEAEEYLDKAVLEAEMQDNYYDKAENHVLRAKIAEEYQDYNRVRDQYIVAFDNFINCNHYHRACSIMKDILGVDHKVNNESLESLTENLVDKFKEYQGGN